jgi:hypothetical protein
MGAPAATTPANGICEELSCIRASSTVVGIGKIFCSYRLMVRLFEFMRLHVTICYIADGALTTGRAERKKEGDRQ